MTDAMKTEIAGAVSDRQQEPRRPVPGVGSVDLGDLRRLQPISRTFGLDRGTPIDRYYIAGFLEQQAQDIRGRVLEVAEDTYARRYGGHRMTRVDILYPPPGHHRATLTADLAQPRSLPSNTFDCIILTQVLLCIYEVRTALANCWQSLRPGGVLLATFPGLSQISRYDMDRWGDYWRFTTRSAARLFSEVFGQEGVTVTAHGNVLAATAFLHGLAAEELHKTELDHRDPDYEVVITVRAVREED